MFLGMTLWFSATAANAANVAEFQLTTGQIAWLTMALQGGFVVGTLVSAVLNLPDVLNARRLCGSCTHVVGDDRQRPVLGNRRLAVGRCVRGPWGDARAGRRTGDRLPPH
jgi:hypothetical protein